MLRPSTPHSCSNTSRLTSSADKESLRRHIVELAVKRDTNLIDNAERKPINGISRSRSNKSTASSLTVDNLHEHNNGHLTDSDQQTTSSVTKRGDFSDFKDSFNSRSTGTNGRRMFQMDDGGRESFRDVNRRSKTTFNFLGGAKPENAKIVRFRMDEHTIGSHKIPLVNIRAVSPGPQAVLNGVRNTSIEKENTCEIGLRGNAIAVRKEGLKGLLDYKDLCSENERRQNSLQASLKIFKRRIRLNQEKFIQPNESTSEDYVIHPARSPFCEVTASTLLVEERPETAEKPTVRPMSSTDHVRMLKSALQSRHFGGNGVVVTKPADTTIYDNGESYKNIKCSYRLPENPNWSKEVSFKDIKDDSIPNVKTYVLQEDRASPHVKYKKNNVQSSVTLNVHNLGVHNSITQVHGHRMKVGEGEVTFDPRFLDWLEDSHTNCKTFSKTAPFTDELTEPCVTPSLTPSVKRRAAPTKT
ncbi:uncharacterized protein LOC127841321 isoform X2 [Dreissena polymorpha]|nr:uncharacterized protein LOC127841321 isoform X2 [Dreissena polymorpha]